MTFFEPEGPGEWVVPRAARPRRGNRARNALTVIGSGLGTVVLIIGMLILTSPPDERFAAFGFLMPPGDEVVEMADQMHLTDEGRAIFFDTKPELLSSDELAERCAETTADNPEADEYLIMGCYGGYDRIAILQPENGLFASFAVTTAAHELLHAAYARLSFQDQTRLDQLTEAAVDLIPADDPVHGQIAASVGVHEQSAGTERFAYLGTQVPDLSPALEKVFSRYIDDRETIVDQYLNP